MQELEKILREIEAEFDRRIDIQLKIMAGLGDDVYRYGYGKSLEAYQQGKLFVEDIIRKHMNDGWIPAEKELPEEHTCIDEETGYYGRSDDVLCSAYDDYTGEYETWIDYTIDGQWQTHEWYEGEPLAWQPLPRPYRT